MSVFEGRFFWYFKWVKRSDKNGEKFSLENKISDLAIEIAIGWYTVLVCQNLKLKVCEIYVYISIVISVLKLQDTFDFAATLWYTLLYVDTAFAFVLKTIYQ